MKYRNIVFDLYGTLIDIRTDEKDPAFWEKVAQYYRKEGAVYTAKEIQKSYLSLVEKEKKKAADPHYPEIDLRNVFSALYRQKGILPSERLIAQTAEHFRLSSLLRFGVYPGVKELLVFLHEQGCRLFLLSNAQRCFTMKELALSGLDEQFEKIFLSSDRGCCKPSPKFFEILIRECGIAPEETLMIGNDWLADMQGAYAAGFSGIYIHQPISPEVTGTLRAEFCAMDGDVFKVLDYLHDKE